MKPFKILTEKTLYDLHGKGEFIEAELERPDGKKVVWHYIHGKHAVVIVAMDAQGDVFLKKEWRLARKDFAVEFPSGWIDEAGNGIPSEDDVRAAAQRELQEEVGMKPRNIVYLGAAFVSNHVDNQYHYVLATELDASKLPGDEDELLEVMKVSLEEAKRILVKDQIPAAQTTTALYLVEEYLSKQPPSGQS